MGIWDRLGNVLKSYINDGAEHLNRQKPFGRSHDDDYNTAYEELEGFLRGEKADSRQDPGPNAAGKSKRSVPPEIKADFAELGLTPEATEEECKDAYKKLLKVYHPDRHSNNPDFIKESTEKAARINSAYDRIEKWYKLSK
ncbi:MAG: J domain-containing protein [Treponema sp.]|jgi:DnaJ-class molecular chaperone|nr:J domain-containing protein [Treponema sp.]